MNENQCGRLALSFRKGGLVPSKLRSAKHSNCSGWPRRSRLCESPAPAEGDTGRSNLGWTIIQTHKALAGAMGQELLELPGSLRVSVAVVAFLSLLF